jgi:NADPH-dependent glutamate synthase beta subunit-like oxidoreductase/glutamate synthase domain-containing protein 3/NAD-dependent dihydropyrimidine dehydrogenase PreA subunit
LSEVKDRHMQKQEPHWIPGMEQGHRVESRILEERIQKAVSDGRRFLKVKAHGQHGIGGRLWGAGDESIHMEIHGSPGQRVGSMGFPNTYIEVMGPASDDVGWLNAGAEIVIHGHATNGTANAMAQGKIYVGGDVGARAMTMTKYNPRFDPPELWVLGSVGDYFAEFMAGGIAVICGYHGQDPGNVLGYRPCVGMVGGRIFFRGPHKGFSQNDAKLIPISDAEWEWLVGNLKVFLEKIHHPHLFGRLSNRYEWQLLGSRSPFERTPKPRRSMSAFIQEVWEAELGAGGLLGDISNVDRSPIPVIATGALRRFVPVWENRKYAPPCEASCPTGIPVQERWQLIRAGRVDEAVDMALSYTPFPATVCGYLCPNLCMEACARQIEKMVPMDVKQLGKASLEAKLPELPPLSGNRIAVIGGGPAGISVAWQLRRQGHEAVVFDMEKTLGGKIASAIPKSRVPGNVVNAELERIRSVLPHVHLQQRLAGEDLEQLKVDYDFVVIAVGAHKPRVLSVPGKEKIVAALDFLKQSKQDLAQVGKRVVIIGAGNVGCDVATEAHRLGAEEIILIHYRRPPAYGEEKEAAEAIGARFRWPCHTKAVTDEGVELSTGEFIPADTVVMATGHEPDIDLPETVATAGGFIKVNDIYQTTDPQVFAIGDAVKLGLLTDAIGAGRKAADAIHDILVGKRPRNDVRQPIEYSRISLEYFDPRLSRFDDIQQCAEQCASCGACRDCGICMAICPQGAISKRENGNGEFEMVVDPERCIGCGFCAGACPCGIWTLVKNEPLA